MDPHSPTSGDDGWLEPLLRWTRRLGWLMAALLVALAGVSLYDGFTTDSHDALAAELEDTQMLAVAPGGVIERSAVPESFVQLYEGAERHPDVFAAVPCFCGCEEMLDHRNLLDCFVRPDGSGWEAHASGCGVCLGEAEQVLALLDAGESQASIVRQVIDEWGDPYLNGEE